MGVTKMKSCRHSGTVYDDTYRSYRYPNGIPTLQCESCGASRKLVLVRYKIARGQIAEQKLIFPYHKRLLDK